MYQLTRSRLSLAVVVVLANVGLAAPQDAGKQAVPGNEITNFKGTLKAFRQGIVVVEKEDGSEALVAVPDQITSFQFVAKAAPAFLRPGMLIRFTADFGPGGVPLAPISKLTLFQPVPTKSLHGRARQLFVAGVYADSKAPNNRKQQTPSGKLTVVGSLVGLTPNGILTLRAGKTPVRVPVNEQTQLELQYNNLSLAQAGDPVTVAGFFQPPNENQVKADRITIRPDRVFGEAPPQEDRKRKTKEDAAKPADENLEGDPAKTNDPDKGDEKPAKPDEGS
ncbi:MAG: hypothetical protein AAFU85_01110 [Planctomycetota bacterium]